jgi:hypothetical protein
VHEYVHEDEDVHEAGGVRALAAGEMGQLFELA